MSIAVQPSSGTAITFTRSSSFQTVDLTSYLLHDGWTKAVLLKFSVGLAASYLVQVRSVGGISIGTQMPTLSFGTVAVNLNASNEIQLLVPASDANVRVVSEIGGDAYEPFAPEITLNTIDNAWATTDLLLETEFPIISVAYAVASAIPTCTLGFRQTFNTGSDDVRTYSGASDNTGGLHVRCPRSLIGRYVDVFNGVSSGATYALTPKTAQIAKGAVAVGYVKKGHGYNTFPAGTVEVSGIATGTDVATSLTDEIGTRGSQVMLHRHRDAVGTGAGGWTDHEPKHSQGTVAYGRYQGYSYMARLSRTQGGTYTAIDSDDHFWIDAYHTNQGGIVKQRKFDKHNQWRI